MTRTKKAEPAIAPVAAAIGAEIRMIPARQLVPRDDNLRESLELDDSFKKSIAQLGVLVPLLVERIIPAEGVTAIEEGFWIDAGHRRREAAIQAFGIDVALPCVVQHELSDVQRTELMLIENLRRLDLNPVEEARGFARLVDYGMTKKDLAAAVGAPESTVTDRIKLLALPSEFLDKVKAGTLTLEHAKELLKLNMLPNPLAAMKKATKNGTYQLHSNVDSQLRAHKRGEKLHAMTVELQEKGWAVARTSSYVSPGKTIKGRTSDGKQCQLTPLKHLGLQGEAGKHSRERCKAKILEFEIYSDKVQETPACSDPTRHTGQEIAGEGKPIAPTSKLVAPPKEVLEQLTKRNSWDPVQTPEQIAAELERKEQERAAEEHHDAFLASLVQGKAIPKSDRIDMLVELLCGQHVLHEASAVGFLLGLEPVMEPKQVWRNGGNVNVEVENYRIPLGAYLEASKTNRERAVWAWTLTKEAGRFQAGEVSPFRQWMEEVGFERHPFDEEQRLLVVNEEAAEAEKLARLSDELRTRIEHFCKAAYGAGYADAEFMEDILQAFDDNDDFDQVVASITAMLDEWELEVLGVEHAPVVVDVGTQNPALNEPGEDAIDQEESAMGMYAGDEDNSDEITSGPIEDHDDDFDPFDDDAGDDVRYEGAQVD